MDNYAKMIFETTRVQGYLLEQDHAPALHRYYANNATHLAPWEPERPEGYHSLESWNERARDYAREQQAGASLRVLTFRPDSDAIAGVCFFTNIVRGVFQACNVGYSISQAEGGKGLMTEIVDASVNYVFENLDLHRVMANYVPENARSARILEKLGFEKEGLARSYIMIGGRWRDHVLTSKINPRHER
jgi:ribosomal-protein-alanine N-acetyltransferase